MESKRIASLRPNPPAKASAADFGVEHYQDAQDALSSFLLERSEVFQRLTDLQEQGWKSVKGDEFYRKMRERSDHADEKTQNHFYNMMMDIGQQMHKTVDAFNLRTPNHAKPRILDMCMAPGGLLSVALRYNPRAEAVGVTLPSSEGGHGMRLLAMNRVQTTYVDITMLAGDLGLGADDIPTDHPDRDQFILERRLPAPPPDRTEETATASSDLGFDLAFCDGQVLRTQARAAYREQREARRLHAAQLALALARLRPGGTLVLLLHKAGAWGTAQTLGAVHRFAAGVRLFKPRPAHAKRSSFYLVATGVRSDGAEARAAVRGWERVWRVATFGTDAEYADLLREGVPDVHKLLDEFGPRLIELATPVWEIQAEALAKAPFMKQE